MSQRESEWVKVYVSSEPQRIEIVKAILEDNHISTHQVDRKDSTYPLWVKLRCMCSNVMPFSPV